MMAFIAFLHRAAVNGGRYCLHIQGDWSALGRCWSVNTFLNYNFSKQLYMLPEDDRMIETCRNVLSVLMWILDH